MGVLDDSPVLESIALNGCACSNAVLAVGSWFISIPIATTSTESA